MATIAGALARIKQDLRPYLSDRKIVDACVEAGHAWRERCFGPVQTIHLFVLQVLWFNTAIRHLRHLAKFPVNAAAYCKARMRLPLKVLQSLVHSSAQALMADTAPQRRRSAAWRGLRALLVDGTSSIVPDVPALQKEFGQPAHCKKGCGFPVPKLLGVLDAFSGVLLEMIVSPLYTHDMSQVWKAHAVLKKGDLVIADRGLCSYVHLVLLSLAGVRGLFRMHQMQIADFRPHRKSRDQVAQGRKRRKGRKRRTYRKGLPSSRFVRRLSKHDQIVQWKKPGQRPKWMNQKQFDSLPEALLVRELRYRIPNKGQRTRCVTIATTLLDPEGYPKEKIAELYGIRWRVETHFAQLKTILRMRKLKCKTPEGAKKELAIYCLVYNLVHAVMMKAAERQRVEPHRISFIDAVRWLLSANPREPLPDLVLNPHRPDRHEPRVVKDREDTYTKMTRPRQVLRKALKRQPIKA